MADRPDLDAAELGRVVANAVTSFLRPSQSRPRETERRNQTRTTAQTRSTIQPDNITRYATTNTTATPSSSTTSSGSTSTMRTTTQAMLPSRFQSFPSSAGSTSKRRTSGSVGKTKTWSKDVVCIPKQWKDECSTSQPSSSTYPIPRGQARGRLAEKGLVGKIRIVSAWSPRQVSAEITSIFQKVFALGEQDLLDYEYLSIVPGTKRLKIPSVSASFTWNGHEVASLAGQGGLYILANSVLMKVEMDPDAAEVAEEGADLISHYERPERQQHIEQIDLESTGEVESSPQYRSYISLLADEDLSDDGNDISMQLALEESARDAQRFLRPASLQDIKDLLQTHTLAVMESTESSGRNYINVRRGHVLKDGIHKINKAIFNPKLPLSVKFADDDGNSEGAVDTGGPTREFFRLCIKEMFSKASIFQGPEGNKVLVHNIQARTQGIYRSYGKLLAISLCNGGNACRCLCKSVYHFLVYGEHERALIPSISDIPDQQTKDILSKVNDSQTEEEFDTAVNNGCVLDLLWASGYTSLPKFAEKDQLLKMIAKYMVIDKPRSALEQLKEGLSTLGILDLMEAHPMEFETLFCFQEKVLTAEDFDSMFTAMMAPGGSNARGKQELILMHWRDFLQECEAGSTNVSLKDILVFCTGAEEVPPCGFVPPPMAEFWPDKRPRGDTCANTIQLPTWPSKDDVSFDEFKEFMEDGILNSPGFGRA